MKTLSQLTRTLLVVGILLASLCAQEARADTKDPISEKKVRTIVTELSVGLPVLYFRNRTEQGTSTSYSLFGYFVDAAFCPKSKVCGTISSHAHVDIRSGRRVFEGPDVGVRYFLLGNTDETAPQTGFFAAQQQSNIRSFIGFSLSQRDFDFRTVVEKRADGLVIDQPNLQGSFWSGAASAGVDILLLGDYRVGFTCHYYQSISASSPDLKNSQILFDFRLLNLTF